MTEQPVRVVAEPELLALEPSHLLIEATAAGGGGALVPPGAVDLAAAARSHGAKVWLVAGIGRVLPERLFAVAAAGGRRGDGPRADAGRAGRPGRRADRARAAGVVRPTHRTARSRPSSSAWPGDPRHARGASLRSSAHGSQRDPARPSRARRAISRPRACSAARRCGRSTPTTAVRPAAGATPAATGPTDPASAAGESADRAAAGTTPARTVATRPGAARRRRSRSRRRPRRSHGAHDPRAAMRTE